MRLKGCKPVMIGLDVGLPILRNFLGRMKVKVIESLSLKGLAQKLLLRTHPSFVAQAHTRRSTSVAADAR